MKFKKSAYSYIIMLGHLCADVGGGALPAILPFLIAQKGTPAPPPRRAEPSPPKSTHSP